jgi:hypothetical protein
MKKENKNETGNKCVKIKRWQIRLANFRRNCWKQNRDQMLRIAGKGSRSAQKRQHSIDEGLRELFKILPGNLIKDELIKNLSLSVNYSTKSGRQKNINNLIRRCVTKGIIAYCIQNDYYLNLMHKSDYLSNVDLVDNS